MGVTNFLKDLAGVGSSAIEAEHARKEAAGIIEMAAKNSAKASVSIKGESLNYKTEIVGCDIENGVFYIDPLLPKSGNHLLEETKRKVDLMLWDHGAEYSMSATFAGTSSWERFSAMKFLLPERIKILQRRGDFRVTPKIIEPVTLVVELDEPFAGETIDISAGGMAFRCKYEMKNGLMVPAELSLPNVDTDISIKLDLLDVSKFEPPRSGVQDQVKFRIRTKFREISNSDVQAIRRYVTQRQRETLKMIG